MNHLVPQTPPINTRPQSSLSGTLIDRLHNSVAPYSRLIEEVDKEFKRRDKQEDSLRKLAEQAQQEANIWKQRYHQLLGQVKQGVNSMCTTVEPSPSASSDVDKACSTTRPSTPVSLADDITASPSLAPPLPVLASKSIESTTKSIKLFPPLVPRPPSAILIKLKCMPQPCFDHYLSPHGCRFPGFMVGRHSFHHDSCLSAVDISALRYIAQSYRCGRGQLCTDPNCYLGHVCPGLCKGQGRGRKQGECTFLPEEHMVCGRGGNGAESKLVEMRAGRLGARAGRFGARVEDNKIMAEGQRIRTVPATSAGASRVSSPAEVAERVVQDLARVLELDGAVGSSAGGVSVLEPSLLD